MMRPNGEAHNAIAAAAYLLALKRPYLSTALWAVKRIEQRGLGTLAVDQRWRMYYDPQVAAKWTVEELQGVVYHELCHLLRAHADRCEAVRAEPVLWNVAADAEINDDLLDEGMELPDGAVTPSTLEQARGGLAEEYYTALTRANWREYVVGVTVTAGRCGSGAVGGQDADDRSGAGWDSEESGLDAGEIVLLRRSVAQAITGHSDGRGTLPGHWTRWAETVLQPQVDWRRNFASSFRRAVAHAAGAIDYSYSRPSRRQPCLGHVVAPALRRPTPSVAVIVDTSGSMTDLLGLALAEIAGILRASGVRDGLHVLSVDAAVHTVRRVWRPEQVELIGGGGTDLRAGFADVQTLRPDVVVALTDGDTPWPDRPPVHSRVVIVDLVGDHAVPSWAEVVRVDPTMNNGLDRSRGGLTQ